MEIKNLIALSNRLQEAVKNKEKIILFGDADPDGICAVLIFEEMLEYLGRKPERVYFVNRAEEGYGLNEKALQTFASESPALLFLLDCGISNFAEIEKARKLNLEVIVIDHHEILDRLPEASLIVDPKQPGDNYSFKGFATAGLVYKLAELVLGSCFDRKLKQSFLELTSLATLADMMPQEQDNKFFIERGLQTLATSSRLGLQAFFNTPLLKDCETPYQMALKIVACLNSGSTTRDHYHETYFLLKTKNEKEANSLANLLLEKYLAKKAEIEKIYRLIEKRISAQPGLPIIFEGDVNWSIPFLGTIASKLSATFKKPTFIFSQKKEKNVGAVRTPPDINSIKAMQHCSRFLLTYGGHAQASGFTVAHENLEKFKKCLIEYFKKI